MSQHTISAISGNPTDEEAAAISAAIDLFAAEMTPTARESEGALNNWQRAALREAVEARQIVANVWGSAPIGPF